MLNGGAAHFGRLPEQLYEKITYAANGKEIGGPGNNMLYSNKLYTDKMIEYIKNTTDRRRYFVYLSFLAHSPFQSPKENVAKYEKTYGVR